MANVWYSIVFRLTITNNGDRSDESNVIIACFACEEIACMNRFLSIGRCEIEDEDQEIPKNCPIDALY